MHEMQAELRPIFDTAILGIFVVLISEIYDAFCYGPKPIDDGQTHLLH